MQRVHKEARCGLLCYTPEMPDSSLENTLVLAAVPHQAALRNAIGLWASATTRDVQRRTDLLRDKQRAIAGFFGLVGKHPAEVQPTDVQDWIAYLEGKKTRPATIYQRVCLLSSFYSWAMKDPDLGAYIRTNPARLARPKAPKPYQTESARSLSDDELQALLSLVQQRAASGDLVGKRDYALLLMFITTGMRRAEVLSLRGKDIRLEENLVLTSKVKGGSYVSREVAEPLVREALLDYLTVARRLHVLKTDAPIWTRHDRGGKPGGPLSSHCYVRNLKRYAAEAGIDRFHLHQTRHTFARIVAEETGSITATQDALDHKNPSTTRVYVQRIAIKRDLHSGRILRRARREVLLT
jgi:integrase